MNLDGDDRRRLLNRVPLLAAARDGPVDRGALQDELDVSRATVYRRTTALTDEGLLERTPKGYRTTGAGCAVVDAADRFERSLSAIDRLDPLLGAVSSPELTRHVDLFADAELAVASPQNPNAPAEMWVEHFSSFESFRSMVVAGCPPEVTEQGVEHAENGAEFEVICTPLALEADRNAAAEAFGTIVTAEGPSLYTHSDLPFTMATVDETVLVSGFDDETALPVASVATDDPDAREWAEDLYRRYRNEADPLTSAAIELSA